MGIDVAVEIKVSVAGMVHVLTTTFEVSLKPNISRTSKICCPSDYVQKHVLRVERVCLTASRAYRPEGLYSDTRVYTK